MHEQNFPALCVGSRFVVPKEKFCQWVEQHTKGGVERKGQSRWSDGRKRKTAFLPRTSYSSSICPAEPSVYLYLLRHADRRTGPCHPSAAAIAKKLHYCRNTVSNYVRLLEERRKLLRLVDTQNTLLEEVKLMSFLAGFKLAWGIAKELETDGLYSFAQEDEERACHLAEQKD